MNVSSIPGVHSNSTPYPEKLGVVGGGVIGLELGSVWARLGAEVVVLEAMDDFLFMADRDDRQGSGEQFKKQGLTFTARRQGDVGASSFGRQRQCELRRQSGKQTLEVDKLVVAVGRRPFTDGLAGRRQRACKLDERGFIDGRRRMPHECVKNVFAVGDCVRGPMLAHKGSEEGVMAADLIAGEDRRGQLQGHSVGDLHGAGNRLGRQDRSRSQRERTRYKTGSFPVRGKWPCQGDGADGRHGQDRVGEEDDDEILGVHIVGPMAGELISEAVLAMEFSGQHRGYPAHDSCAPEPRRGDPRGIAGGRQPGTELPEQVAKRVSSSGVPRSRSAAARADRSPAQRRQSRYRNLQLHRPTCMVFRSLLVLTLSTLTFSSASTLLMSFSKPCRSNACTCQFGRIDRIRCTAPVHFDDAFRRASRRFR